MWISWISNQQIAQGKGKKRSVAIKVNRALFPRNGFMFSGGRKTDHLSVALQIIPSSDHLTKKPLFSHRVGQENEAIPVDLAMLVPRWVYTLEDIFQIRKFFWLITFGIFGFIHKPIHTSVNRWFKVFTFRFRIQFRISSHVRPKWDVLISDTRILEQGTAYMIPEWLRELVSFQSEARTVLRW